MSAKKTTKKKTAAKKTAKVMADAINTIIETVSEPTHQPALDVFDEDDYNPYAPNNVSDEWANKTPTFSSLNDDEPYSEPKVIITPQSKPAPQVVPVDEPSLPVIAPSERAATPPAAPSSTVSQDELTGNALIVQRLINAINYMYPIARTVKGQKGLQPDAVKKIADNIALARQLVTQLS